MAFGQLVAVQQDFLRCLEAVMLATEDRIFLAFLIPRIMIILADFDRHRIVILLDTSSYLLEELFLKRFRMLQTSFCILVFGLKIGQNLRVFALVEPIVVINTGMAVHRHLMGTDGGLGGCKSVFHCLITHQKENVKPKVGRMGNWRAMSLVTRLT